MVEFIASFCFTEWVLNSSSNKITAKGLSVCENLRPEKQIAQH